VRQIIDAEYERAYRIVTENRDKLELVAQRLLEVETLEADEFAALVEGGETAPTSSPPALQPTRAADSQSSEEREVWPRRPKIDLPPAPSPA
jgi:cell division protease FtsH